MDKVTLKVMDLVEGTSTNINAVPLFLEMDKVIIANKVIVLSLKNAPALSSSFLNSSIGELVTKHGFNTLKGRLKIVDYTPVMADLIKNYLENLKEGVNYK
ncbi:hypothetical protein BH09BAC5_BH09BAC5_10480 [soil metagenome]